MKAVVCIKYGKSEEVFQMKEVDKPVPKENEVLIVTGSLYFISAIRKLLV